MPSQDSETTAPAALAASQFAAGNQTYRGHGDQIRTILLVEDEPLIRASLADALREAGFIVVEAADASEALAWLTALSAIAIVISDITMPGPLDGKGLAEKARFMCPNLPIILMSGCAGQLASTPHNLFLQKPFSIDDLFDGIAKLGRGA